MRRDIPHEDGFRHGDLVGERPVVGAAGQQEHHLDGEHHLNLMPGLVDAGGGKTALKVSSDALQAQHLHRDVRAQVGEQRDAPGSAQGHLDGLFLHLPQRLADSTGHIRSQDIEGGHVSGQPLQLAVLVVLQLDELAVGDLPVRRVLDADLVDGVVDHRLQVGQSNF